MCSLVELLTFFTYILYFTFKISIAHLSVLWDPSSVAVLRSFIYLFLQILHWGIVICDFGHDNKM